MLNLDELYGKPSDLAPLTKFNSVMAHFRMKFSLRKTTRFHLTDPSIGVV